MPWRVATAEQLAGGVVTASAGNMAQGVAWNARLLGIACHVVVPDHAPETKLKADPSPGRNDRQGAFRSLVADYRQRRL